MPPKPERVPLPDDDKYDVGVPDLQKPYWISRPCCMPLEIIKNITLRVTHEERVRQKCRLGNAWPQPQEDDHILSFPIRSLYGFMLTILSLPTSRLSLGPSGPTARGAQTVA